MKPEPLTLHEIELIQAIFKKYPEITQVKLFGSRAKGTHLPHSDIDLAVWGKIDSLQVEALAAELEELPLPNRFDVLPFALVESVPLREHIERVGLTLYRSMGSSGDDGLGLYLDPMVHGH